MWLAGGGIKGGHRLRRDRRARLRRRRGRLHVHDLHATMLHLLGIDHDAFSVKFQGLDARLTGVEGAKVIKDILDLIEHEGRPAMKPSPVLARHPPRVSWARPRRAWARSRWPRCSARRPCGPRRRGAPWASCRCRRRPSA